jgi:hypothetical protein
MQVLDFRKAHSQFYKSIPVSSPSERDRHLPDRRAFRPEEKVLRSMLLAESIPDRLQYASGLLKRNDNVAPMV